MQRVLDFIKKEFKCDGKLHSWQSGETANSWTVPRSWTVKSFVLIGPNGNVIATERDHPLVVCPFSNSIDKVMPLDEFKRHVISDPQRADDYIFTFAKCIAIGRRWAISLPHKILEGLEDGQYRVKIATKLEDAPMPVLEYHIEGAVSDTICLVAHFDHPGMVNDSLSGCIALLQTVEMLESLLLKLGIVTGFFWCLSILAVLHGC